jgi:guanylate kinase
LAFIKQQDLDLEFSISAATREPRGEELSGKDYYLCL